MEEKVFREPVEIMLNGLLHDEMNGKNDPFIVRIRKRPLYYIFVLLFLINISLIAVNIGTWIIAAYQKLFIAADFTSFYTGFYMVRVGDGANLYDMAAQARYQLQFMGGWVFEGGVLLFPNPPFVALILSPLSILPLNAAFYLWSFIQLGLIIWLIFGFNRHFIDWSKQERLLMVTAILAFWPLAKTLLLGQFSIILLIGLFQTFIAMKNLKLTQSGLWLVLLAIKPHTLFIPAMMTLNKRNWRMAASALIVGIFLFIFTSLFLGIKPWIQYIQNLLTMSTFYGKLGVNPSGEYTLRGVLSNLLGNSQGNLTNLISSSILLCGMIYVGFLWWKDVSAGSSKFSLYFAFTILLTVILSLHLNPHDALVLVLPAVLFYDYLRQNNYPRKVISILFLLCPTIFFIDAFHSINLLGFIRLPIVVMMIVLCWMVKYLVLEYRITQRTKLPGNAPLA